jgi:hypothetical protein
MSDMYINILIIIIFYLKKFGSRCFDPQFQKWVAMWADVHFFTSKDSKRTIFFIININSISLFISFYKHYLLHKDFNYWYKNMSIMAFHKNILVFLFPN